jgi:hypothetical protein
VPDLAQDLDQGLIKGLYLVSLNPTQEKAEEICLMLIEAANSSEAILEPVIKGITEGKTPKLIAACVHVITSALNAFGPKVVSPKAFMKELPKLFAHADKAVRDEVSTPLPLDVTHNHHHPRPKHWPLSSSVGWVLR